MSFYKNVLFLGFTLISSHLFAQTDSLALDSLTHKSYLPNLYIVGSRSHNDIQQLPEIVGTSIYAGKKNALLVLENVQGNTAMNTMRQVMAKVPGVHVWESDPSGTQIGIAARGLSPNRSWEFNTRQNGYDIAADPYGYPEAYYNPQLQSVQRIEIIRGQGALQYGPQFGGMVNYILKNGSQINRPFAVEVQQTLGANSLFDSYNAIGGKTKKLHYYTFFNHKNGDGWRKNSRFETNSGFATLTYKFSSKFSLSAEVLRYGMTSQQAGGLTDADFANDAQQSKRARNWFGLDWTTVALIGNLHLGEQHDLSIKTFGILGDRNSTGFLPSTGIITNDTINKTLNNYNPRTVNLDKYRNWGIEARYLNTFQLGSMKNTFSGGLRAYKGNTQRWKADKKGTTGSDADYSINGVWDEITDYNTTNYAVFVENIFRFWNEKLLVIPGVRYEWLTGNAGGYKGLKNNVAQPLVAQERTRGFVLSGIGLEYHTDQSREIYGNISQAYRPIQFADLTTPPTTDVIDPSLTDATGYNADLGYRGKIKNFLQFDVSAYYLQYNNRVGTLQQQRIDGSFYNLRTNIGNSSSKGVEAFAEFSPIKAFLTEKPSDITIFASYAYNDSRYGDLKTVTKSGTTLVENNLQNKTVENAPAHILRTGLSYWYKGFGATAQYSHTAQAFADANNTETASANGQNGLIPAYNLLDLTFSYRFKKQYHLKAGINNVTDTRYFTRRAGGFPGPGALPADGRTWFVSVGGNF
jgi:Fe(3+) dicitrate transport protein